MNKFSWDEYCQHAAMNGSRIVQGFTSMLALKEAIEGNIPEPTPDLQFGNVGHKIVLEPDEFRQQYVIMPDFSKDPENVDGKGKASTSWATSWAVSRKECFIEEAAAAGKLIVGQADFDRALEMLASIQSKPLARQIIAECHKEATLFGEIEGVEFKGRLDLFGGPWLADLKTAATVNPRLFGSSACRYRYPEKMSIYRELARQNGSPIEDAWIIAIEKSRPFDCCVFCMRSIVLDEAYERVLRVVRKYKQCLATGIWPGVDEGAEYLEFAVPNWAMGDEELVTFA